VEPAPLHQLFSAAHRACHNGFAIHYIHIKVPWRDKPKIWGRERYGRERGRKRERERWRPAGVCRGKQVRMKEKEKN
jgi:SLT domain-containing protein